MRGWLPGSRRPLTRRRPAQPCCQGAAMGPPGMEERVGRTGGRSPVPQILPACKTFHLNSNPAVLLGPGRAAPDAKVGPSPCPRQSGREGSAALSLNLNRVLWPRPDRRLETRRSEAAGMVNADPEPTEQTSRSPPSSPRKSEPSLRPPPPPPEPGDSAKGFLPKPAAPLTVLSFP